MATVNSKFLLVGLCCISSVLITACGQQEAEAPTAAPAPTEVAATAVAPAPLNTQPPVAEPIAAVKPVPKTADSNAAETQAEKEVIAK